MTKKKKFDTLRGKIDADPARRARVDSAKADLLGEVAAGGRRLDDLTEAVPRRRDQKEFRARLDTIIEQDRELLDRLASGTSDPPSDALRPGDAPTPADGDDLRLQRMARMAELTPLPRAPRRPD